MFRNVVLYGDALARLKELPGECVQACVTSPPYYGLRRYGTQATEIGREDSPQEYVGRLVEVFREVRRTLRDTGVLWLNLGDSYAGSGKGPAEHVAHNLNVNDGRVPPGMKPKDLMMIPAQVAVALRADGWYLRAEIVWSKTSCMPESVTDRPTRSHEMVYLLSKSRVYHYDLDAVREPFAESTVVGQRERGRHDGQVTVDGIPGRSRMGGLKSCMPHPLGRNRRSVWSIAPSRVGGHTAVMPVELAEICIRAGSRPGDLVLDPFAGSATTLMVAKTLERDYVGIELNEAYRPLIEQRLARADRSRAELEAFRQEVRMRSGSATGTPLDDEASFKVVATLINIDELVAQVVADIEADPRGPQEARKTA